MNTYKKLIDNSMIFAVGNLGSKLISFILVPIYTYYLSTEQYGLSDLIMTTTAMLVPIVSLNIFEAVLRFVMDKSKSRDSIMANSIIIAVLGIISALTFYPILTYFNVFEDNLLYLYLLLLVQIFERIFAQYARAVGKVKIFALNGMLLTLTTGTLSIWFLVFLGWGLSGYFWAIILSNITSITFLFFTTKAYKDISFLTVNKKTIKELLVYSVPLIPNSLMWSFMNTFSRYFILFFAGVSANGLFAVASKIPILINVIIQIFSQAWQISAIEEYENENKSAFYTNVFAYFSSILFISASALILVIKIVFALFFSADYYSAWTVVPFLLLSTVFSGFSNFLGTNYIAAKQTKGVFKTSIYGGCISLGLNFLLIPTFGIIGAGISSMVSFFTLFVIRFHDTKKYIDLKINWSLFIKNLTIIFVQIAVLFVSLPKTQELIIEAVLFLILLTVNRKLLVPVFKMFKKFK